MATTELASTETTIDPDGYIVDSQGEILGHIGDGDRVPAHDVRHDEPFTPNSEAAAEWVLKLKMEAESEILKIEATRAAINANLDGQLVQPRNRLRWLSIRFDNALEDWARRFLTESRSKIKTVKLVFGSISFRSNKGSARITDPDAALAYVQEWAPHRLKYKPVGIEDMKAAMDAEKTEQEQEPDVAGFFEQAKPSESVSIKTGIKE